MISVSIHIDEAPETVWPTMVDVERWPSWTPSVTRLEKLEPGALQARQRVRIKQPRLPVMEWRVTEFRPNRRFSWRTTNRGVTSIGGHELRASAAGVPTSR